MVVCSDLFADGGIDHPPIFEGDILGPSDVFRRKLDFYTHTRETRAARRPKTNHGDCAKLLLALLTP
jgi:hypothetical protein